MSARVETVYCSKHSLSDCDECNQAFCVHEQPCGRCKPPQYAGACYWCDRPTDTYAVDEDPQVGYRGRLYYCGEHQDRVIEEGLL